MSRKNRAYHNGKHGAVEPIYYGIKKKAVDAWVALCEAMDRETYWNCLGLPYFYTDYDGKGYEDENGKEINAPLTEDQAERLCFGCPLIRECYQFAVLNEESTGVWGGINFDKKVDKE